MAYQRVITRTAIALILAVAAWFLGGFLFTPKIDLQKHKPIGDHLWSRIEAYRGASGHFPRSEKELLESNVFSSAERRMFLDRNFGHRKFHYIVQERYGPSLTLDHMPGALNAITVWRDKSKAEPSHTANGRQPFSAETNGTSSAVGTGR
jgi:hypothetical protein